MSARDYIRWNCHACRRRRTHQRQTSPSSPSGTATPFSPTSHSGKADAAPSSQSRVSSPRPCERCLQARHPQDQPQPAARTTQQRRRNTSLPTSTTASKDKQCEAPPPPGQGRAGRFLNLPSPSPSRPNVRMMTRGPSIPPLACPIRVWIIGGLAPKRQVLCDTARGRVEEGKKVVDGSRMLQC